MRRDYYKDSGGEIPEGCVLWLPLSEEGDLVERVTGQTLALTGNGSIIWDASQNMYKITNPSTNEQYVASINIPNLIDQFPNDEFTILEDIYGCKDGQSLIYNVFSLKSPSASTISALGPMYNGTGIASNWPKRRFKYAWSCSSSSRKLWIDGSLQANYAAYAPYQPSGWTGVDNPNFLMGYSTSLKWGSNQSQMLIKNIMLFNRVLTQAEIKQIQNIP